MHGACPGGCVNSMKIVYRGVNMSMVYVATGGGA